jgi:hypothetical protein
MATKKEIIVIAKYTIKSNGAVIYRMRSNIANRKGRIEKTDQVERNGKWFDVYQVSSDGEYVFGCQTSGEPCKGNMYRGTCCHRKHVQKLLDAAKDAKVAEPVIEIVEEAVAPAEPIEAPAVEAVVAEAPKPTYRIISLGAKKERFDLLSEIEAKREHKATILAEAREIKARKRTEDISQRGNLIPTRVLRCHFEMWKIRHGTNKLRILFKMLQSMTKSINNCIKGGKCTVRKILFS